MRHFTLTLLLIAAIAAVGQQTETVKGAKAISSEVIVKYKPSCEATALTTHKQAHDIDHEHQLGSVAHVHHLHSRSKTAQQLIDGLKNNSCVEYAIPNAAHIAIPQSTPNDPNFNLQWFLNNTGQIVPYADGSTHSYCSVTCTSGTSCSCTGGNNSTNTATAGKDVFGGNASAAWALTTGGTSYAVAFADEGVDCSIPELSANCWSAPAQYNVTVNGAQYSCPAGSHGFSASTLSCNPAGDYPTEGNFFFHGNFGAGEAGAVSNNSTGVAGENWNAKIVGIRGPEGSNAQLVEALDIALQLKQLYVSSGGTNGANIRAVNLSFIMGDSLVNGCPVLSSGPSEAQPLHDEIAALGANGILFVTVAANYGTTGMCANDDSYAIYPASWTDLPNMIVVASTTDTDARAYFSNIGPTTVNLAAPGTAIYSTIYSGFNSYAQGTSFSAPLVTGAVPLILSVCPNLDTNGIKLNILDNVDTVAAWSGLTTTGGRLNIYKALEACTGDTTGPTLAITSPTAGTVTGHITITPSCSDSGSGCRQVTIYDGSTVLATLNASPWSYAWNTTLTANGSHSLSAVAYDAAGNKTTSATVAVTVSNSVVTSFSGAQTKSAVIQ